MWNTLLFNESCPKTILPRDGTQNTAWDWCRRQSNMLYFQIPLLAVGLPSEEFLQFLQKNQRFNLCCIRSCLIWSDLIWSGLVLSGLVWSGLWSGLAWSWIILSYLIRWSDLIWIWSDLIWSRLIWSHLILSHLISLYLILSYLNTQMPVCVVGVVKVGSMWEALPAFCAT